MIGSLNHLTLSVTDLARSEAFYVDLLGMTLLARWPRGRYLRSGETWVALVLDLRAVERPLTEYTHVAFDAADFAGSVVRLEAAGVPTWQPNSSEGASHYFLDPDGHKLELHATGLASRLAHLRAAPWPDVELVGEAVHPTEAELEDHELLALFQASRLAPSTWTHTAHLRVAWCLLSAHSFDEARALMRAGVKALNAAHGRVEQIDRGYHETVTVAWLRLVAATRQAHGPEATSAAFVAAYPELGSSTLLRLYYTREQLLTAEAKATFVAPDLAPLP